MSCSLWMYFRKMCFLLWLLFVSSGLTECLRLCARLEQVQPERQNRKEKSHRVCTHVAWFELCVTLGKAKLFLEDKIWEKELLEVVSVYNYFLSCDRLQMHRIKSKDADVVESINQVTFLTNRFSKLISLSTSTMFVLGMSESISNFLEFFVSQPF